MKIDLPIIISVLVTVVTIVLVFFLFSKLALDSWGKVAKIYPYNGPFPEKEYLVAFVTIGGLNRYQTVFFSFNEKGLFMHGPMPKLLKFLYPPIFVSWSDVSLTKSNDIRLVFKKAPDFPVTFKSRNDMGHFINDLGNSSPAGVTVS